MAAQAPISWPALTRPPQGVLPPLHHLTVLMRVGPRRPSLFPSHPSQGCVSPREGGGPWFGQAAGTQFYLYSRLSPSEKPTSSTKKVESPQLCSVGPSGYAHAATSPPGPRIFLGRGCAVVWYTQQQQALCLFPTRAGVVRSWPAICRMEGHRPRQEAVRCVTGPAPQALLHR